MAQQSICRGWSMSRQTTVVAFRCWPVWIVLLPAGCASVPREQATALGIARLTGLVQVDGRLEEPCYQRVIPVTDFQVASRPGAKAGPTQAWLQWNDAGLWFAFGAHDTTIVAAPPTGDEHAADVQDRVEIFLWPQNSRRYFCLEIAPDGAVHDYAARIYRRFDDSWTPAGARLAARRAVDGYTVEGLIPAAALHTMGVSSWKPGTRLDLGLYRADFRPEAPEDPTWLTWVEPNLPQPDFHVRATFAPVELTP
jgi:hypothetical protein